MCDISVVPSFVFLKVGKKDDSQDKRGEENSKSQIKISVQEKMEGVHPHELSEKVASFATYLENVAQKKTTSSSYSHHQQQQGSVATMTKEIQSTKTMNNTEDEN